MSIRTTNQTLALSEALHTQSKLELYQSILDLHFVYSRAPLQFARGSGWESTRGIADIEDTNN